MSSSQPAALPPTTAATRIQQPGPEGRFARLPSPAELRRDLPVPGPACERIARARDEIARVLHGEDPERLVVVAGPCSLHDRGSALEYARRLAAAARWHRRELVVVMRTYVEKPRSGVGWKGFLNDPDLDGRCDAREGLRRSRELLLEIAALGVPCASEILDPIAARYLEDLLSWTAIGARTATSQTHRELASGLPMPVGVKNPLDGDVAAAVQGALACRSAHTALAIDDSGRAGAVQTDGNPNAHVVLRGGDPGPNHDAASVAAAATACGALDLPRPLFVDCSHANSGKDPDRQAAVCREVLDQVAVGRSEIAGVLLESHLRAGRQSLRPGERPAPDQSITDACLGWEETAELLEAAARAVRNGLR